MQLGVALLLVGAVEGVAQKPQEERERLRSRGPACEGARQLLLQRPVTSGTGALPLLPVEELEELAPEASPGEWYLMLCTSLERSFPWLRFSRRLPPCRREVPLPLSVPAPRRNLAHGRPSPFQLSGADGPGLRRGGWSCLRPQFHPPRSGAGGPRYPRGGRKCRRPVQSLPHVRELVAAGTRGGPPAEAPASGNRQLFAVRPTWRARRTPVVLEAESKAAQQNVTSCSVVKSRMSLARW